MTMPARKVKSVRPTLAVAPSLEARKESVDLVGAKKGRFTQRRLTDTGPTFCGKDCDSQCDAKPECTYMALKTCVEFD